MQPIDHHNRNKFELSEKKEHMLVMIEILNLTFWKQKKHNDTNNSDNNNDKRRSNTVKSQHI